jgi:hypothetical protein
VVIEEPHASRCSRRGDHSSGRQSLIRRNNPSTFSRQPETPGSKASPNCIVSPESFDESAVHQPSHPSLSELLAAEMQAGYLWRPEIPIQPNIPQNPPVSFRETGPEIL